MSLPPEIEALKAEGNALYLAGDHTAAINKYTIAITTVSDNAILFANRAACHLALRQYEQAREDAQKATELDSKYAKGWGRLGSALEGISSYKEALDAYGKAIECIQVLSTLSDTDKKLKAQYKSCFTRMELLSESRHITMKESDLVDKRMPWDLVDEMGGDLPAESSGQVVLAAWKGLERSKAILKSLTVYPNGLMGGRVGGLEELSNAILTEERCIILKGDDSLVKDYNQYLQFEICRFNAWVSVTKPREIIRLAKHRLSQTGNWDSIRGALACQARAWIILGFLGQVSHITRDELFNWYDRTCKLIELGQMEWPDVPRDLRGTIFDTTFLRGVQVLRMNAYMQAQCKPPSCLWQVHAGWPVDSSR